LYKDHELFKNFPFVKERYQDRINTLRTAIKRSYTWAEYDNKAVVEDLEKHPLKQSNVKGEPRWEGSEAQRLLKLDVDNGVHLQANYDKPSKLRDSREAYKEFGKEKFWKHLYQEIKSRKGHVGNHKYTRNVFGRKDLSRYLPNDVNEENNNSSTN
jgi:hypothetical protein